MEHPREAPVSLNIFCKSHDDYLTAAYETLLQTELAL